MPLLGPGEVPVDALWVQGTLAADLEGVVVDRLSFTTNGAHLSGRGEVAWRAGEPTLQAEVEAENVTIDHIGRFWPPREGRKARAWVLENIAGGFVPTARAQIRFGPGELGQKPLPEHTLAGEFEFQDLTVRFVDTMPPLVGVDGSATFTGQRMDFAVASGHLDDLVVDQGTVVITGIGIKGRDTTQLEISAGVSGPLEQALSLIERPPLGYASRVGITPETGIRTRGQRAAHRHAAAPGSGAIKGGAGRGRSDDHGCRDPGRAGRRQGRSAEPHPRRRYGQSRGGCGRGGRADHRGGAGHNRWRMAPLAAISCRDRPMPGCCRSSAWICRSTSKDRSASQRR